MKMSIKSLSESTSSRALGEISCPQCRRAIRKSMLIMTDTLDDMGVPSALIDSCLAEITKKIGVSIDHGEHTCSAKAFTYDRKKFFENERKDYLGRALIYNLEKIFPTTVEEQIRVRERAEEGKAPREVAEGLIKAIKSTLDFHQLNAYETLCLNKAAMYRDNKNHVIDVDRFVKDPEVRGTIGTIMSRLALVLEEMGEEQADKWLLRNVLHGNAFTALGRDLDDDEFDLIKKILLS